VRAADRDVARPERELVDPKIGDELFQPSPGPAEAIKRSNVGFM
jgi:hypothetical protein